MTTLLAMGADPDMPNERGWTVLHQAAYRNDPPMGCAPPRRRRGSHARGAWCGRNPAGAEACFLGHVESVDTTAFNR